MTQKEYPLAYQPYEKLEIYGPKSLTTTELLAIIINSGTKSIKAIDIASKVLSMHSDGLIGLHRTTIEELKHVEGIGRVKAIQLKALAELSIRFSKSNPLTKICVSSPKVIANLYMEELRHLKQEHIKIIVLDNKNYIIKDQTLSIGTVNATLVNPREVLIYCLRHHCVQYIMIHNHPSGDSSPSKEDILLTRRMKKASDLVGLHLLDHIIIGNLEYTSLKETGDLITS